MAGTCSFVVCTRGICQQKPRPQLQVQVQVLQTCTRVQVQVPSTACLILAVGLNRFQLRSAAVVLSSTR